MNGSTPVTRVLPRATGPVSSRRPRCRALHTCVRAVDQRVPGRFTGLTRSGMGVPGPRGVDGLMRRLIVGGASGAALTASARRIALRGAIALGIALAGLVTWVAAGGTTSADAQHGAPVAALDTMPVPRPPDEASYIKDKAAAVKLGKALFWDMQAGSDGRQACAPCHFASGADSRSRNQINPRMPAGSANAFQLKGPNAQLTAADFPFHKLADPNDAASVLSDTSNVAGSQGGLPSKVDGVPAGEPADDQTFATSDPDFSVDGQPVRRSTGRNTPSV